MNDIPTTLKCGINSLFVADNLCNLFAVDTGQTGSKIKWYSFPATKDMMDSMIQSKLASSGDYSFEPQLNTTGSFQIDPRNGWTFRMLNRDLSGGLGAMDTFALNCNDGVWYVPWFGFGILSPHNGNYSIRDMAYVHGTNRLFVLFDGDYPSCNIIYAYDNIQDMVNFDNLVVLTKENANQRIETFNSITVTENPIINKKVFLDYSSAEEWKVSIYGEGVGEFNVERWKDSPSGNMSFRKYNTVLFGDSLFDEAQLRFHNISKTKDMYDILDVNEVDKNYYGLFKDDTRDGEFYTVFKCPQEGKGVVQKLSWNISHPSMYTTADSLYSLYVV